MSPRVKKVGDFGKSVELTDGSKWEVDSMHTGKSSLWMAGDEIAIVSSKNMTYPCILVNLRSVVCVLAKRKSA